MCPNPSLSWVLQENLCDTFNFWKTFSKGVIFSVGKRLGASSEFIRSHVSVKFDGNNNVNGEYALDREGVLDTNQDFYWLNVYVEGLGYAYYNSVNNAMKVHIPSFVTEITVNDVAPAQIGPLLARAWLGWTIPQE